MTHPVQIGQTVGAYRVVRQLGEGGMGTVYEVIHLELERRAAIKVMLPHYAQNPMLRARFVREAKATNRVNHPGVVQIYEIGELPDKTPYFIMEYLDGETLAKRLDDAQAGLAGRLGIGGLFALRQVASILAKVHERGLVHRDLKPNNLMLVSDPEVPGGERAKLLDFGIVKQAEPPPPAGSAQDKPRPAPLTAAGSIMGTPEYMAPEQWGTDQPITDRADVYSLGVMAYRILSGRLPFLGSEPVALLRQHAMDPPPPLSTLYPDLRPELCALVHRMLAKRPIERPPMAEVVVTLERLLDLPPEKASAQIVIPDSFSSAQQLPVSGSPSGQVPVPSPLTSSSDGAQSGAFVPSQRPARADATTAGGGKKPALPGRTLALDAEDLLPDAPAEQAGSGPPPSPGAASPGAVGAPPPPIGRSVGRWALLLAAVFLLLLGSFYMGCPRSSGLGGGDAAIEDHATLPPPDTVEPAQDAAIPGAGPADGGLDAYASDDAGGLDLGADLAPDLASPPSPSPPPPPPNPPPPRPRVLFHSGCIKTQGLGSQIEGLLLVGFGQSLRQIPAMETVWIDRDASGKPRVVRGLRGLKPDERQLLEYTLSGLFNKAHTPFPSRVEILCPVR